MKEVKRHAKIGEYIKIVDCDDIMGNGYENGDIFIVIEVNDNGTVSGISKKYTCGYGWCFYDEEYVVLEDYNPDEAKYLEVSVDKVDTNLVDIIKKLQSNVSFGFTLDEKHKDGKESTLLWFDELINEEREEEDMNKVLKLYEERKLKEIDDKYDKKIDDDYNAIEVVKQYNDLVNNFENKLEELFTSLDNFNNSYLVTQCDSNCYKYVLSEDRIKNELRRKYVDEQMKEVNDVKKLVSEVDSQLSLSDDLTYQLEVLSRYEIIDKKTNKLKV